MMRIGAVIAEIPGADGAEVFDWIARGWVLPGGDAPDWVFTEVDIARVRLVQTLRVEVGIVDDAMGVVLNLLDQVHELRGALRGVMRSLEIRPELRELVLREIAAGRDR